MQLNVYVPNERASVIRRLKEVSVQTGRPQNELVLEALEAFLKPERPQLGRFDLGKVSLGARGDLYGPRLRRR